MAAHSDTEERDNIVEELRHQCICDEWLGGECPMCRAAQRITDLQGENDRLAKIEATVERVGCETCWQFHHPTNKHQEGEGKSE